MPHGRNPFRFLKMPMGVVRRTSNQYIWHISRVPYVIGSIYICRKVGGGLPLSPEKLFSLQDPCPASCSTGVSAAWTAGAEGMPGGLPTLFAGAPQCCYPPRGRVR